ncbi:MAG: hypothetical protein ABMA13_01620 [Chthoniobacteraceae bacterium]
MKTKHHTSREAGFTLVEMSMYMLIASLVVSLSLSFLMSGASLTTKNLNINRSHDDLRLAFDRLAHHLSAANNVATLIDSAGDTVSGPVTAVTSPMVGTVTGPAQGLKFDRVIGEPFVLESPQTANNPLAAGTLASTITSVNVFYPKHSLTHVAHLTPTAAAASVANEGYIILIPLLNGTFARARITSIGARNSSHAVWHKVQLNFAAPLGQTVTWAANQPQVVKIVRSEAFLVMRMNAGTSTERCELRYYKGFDPMPVLTDASKYTVLCDQIGIRTGEDKPFSVADYNGDRLVQSTLRVRERNSTQWIGSDVNESFYTYFQLHVNLPSRFRPRTTN